MLTLLLALALRSARRGARRLSGRRLARAHLLLSAFGVQAAEPLLSGAVPYSYPLAFAVSGTLMTQFVVRNAAVPGVALAGVGLALNAAVVVVNGAMPVSLAAAAHAGLPVERFDLGSDRRHERLDGTTRLGALADIVPTPIPGRREVTSPGDVLLAAGVGLYVFSATRSRPRPRGTVSAGTPARITEEAGTWMPRT